MKKPPAYATTLEIRVTLKMKGSRRNCSKVRKILAERIASALMIGPIQTVEEYVDYRWTITCPAGK